jgi:membrane protease YdiL (CAAX protease family)
MAALGPDFQLARKAWLYDLSAKPSLVIAVVSLVGLFVLMAVLQTACGFAVYALQNGFSFDGSADAAAQSNFAKATIIGMLPAGTLTALAAWWLARLSYAPENRGMPLHYPRLGVLGWFLVLAGFVVFLYLLFLGLFTALGINPSEYMPDAGGLSDDQSKAGLVEKVLADMADEPLAFALALPGVTVAVPISEELIFRGPIFAAIAGSRVGRWGAVVITSAAWALIHVSAPWLFVAIIFLMGLVLSLLLLRFGSLWVPIACHGLWNAMTSFAFLGAQNLPGSQ